MAKHMLTVESMIAKDKQQSREESRNQAVGMRIGRLVYYLSYNARADADFTLLIYLMKRAGVDVGDINHSHHMVDKLLPYISQAVKNRLKKMLSTRMEATGCLPPVNIMADKPLKRGTVSSWWVL